MDVEQLLVSKPDAIKMFGMGRDMFDKLSKENPTFPIGRKLGQTQQAKVFYRYKDLVEWIDSFFVGDMDKLQCS